MMWRLGTLTLLLVVLTSGNSVRADTAAFDLSGPRIDVRVTRGAKTLPIAQVPNLQAGDRIWLRPDLPEEDRKSTRLNSSHSQISYAVFCLKKKKARKDRHGDARDRVP